MLIYTFRTNELCKGNFLVLILTLYLKKRVSKEYTQKTIFGLGRNGAKIFFDFPIYLIQKMTILAKKIKPFIH